MKTGIDGYLSDFMNAMLEYDGDYKSNIGALLEQIRGAFGLDVVCITEPLGIARFTYLYVAYSKPEYDLSGQIVELPPEHFEVALHMYDNSPLNINNENDSKGAFPTPYNMHYGCVRGRNKEFDGAICFMSFTERHWTLEEQDALRKLGRLYRLLLNVDLSEQIDLHLYEERRQKELMHLKAERESSRASEQQFRAEHDALTGIFNRAAFDRMTEMLRTNPHPMAFVLLDVDNFKTVNDTYGHDIGDVILKRVAYLLSTHFRESDAAFRFGGDEFALILTNYKDGQQQFIVKKIDEVNKLLACHARAVSEDTDSAGAEGHLPAVSVSAGAAFSEHGYSDELFKQADAALYQVKKTEKGRCGIYCDSSAN